MNCSQVLFPGTAIMDQVNELIEQKSLQMSLENDATFTPDQPTYLTKNDICVSINDSHCIMQDGKQQWKCHICPKTYTRKHSLVTHIMSHVGLKPFSCTECGKSFRQVSHLETHMSIHRQDKNYKCEYCNRTFAQLTHLKRHRLLHLDKKPYTCELCSRGFAYPSELRKHLDKHREADECQECGKEVAPEKMEYHIMNKHTVGRSKCQIVCDLCNSVFSHPSSLQEHIESEHGESLKHHCTKCSMKFVDKSHLQSHMLTHKENKTFSCLVCGRGFSQKGNMERHMLIHSKEKQFECETCGKRFWQQQVLKMHQISHSSMKPFVCSICGKMLARNHNLKAHLALHMNKKPYKCSVCNSSFTLKGNLYRHQKEKHGSIVKVSDCHEEQEAIELDEINGGELSIDCSEQFKEDSKNGVPLSLLKLQTNGSPSTEAGNVPVDSFESPKCGNEKLVKRRKGSPKRIMASSRSPSPDLPNKVVSNANVLENLPNSPDKAETSCPSNSLPTVLPPTSSIPLDLPSANLPSSSSFSPMASSDFLLSGSLSADLMSPYFGMSSSSSAFPHLSSSYPTQSVVSSLRPMVPLDTNTRHYPTSDFNSGTSSYLSIGDTYNFLPRNNDSVSAKLQFVHGEIDELANKLSDYSSEKVSALHVAVNELAGLHMSLSPSFNEPSGNFFT